MPTVRRLAWVIVAVPLLLAASIARSQEAKPDPATEPTVSAERWILDEYNVEVFGGRHTSKISAGLTFGDTFGDWFVQVGPRISWVDYRKRRRDEAGIAAGVYATVGWKPAAWIAPVGIAALDVPFGTGDKARLQATLGGGARFRLSNDTHEFFALTFAGYYTRVTASGPYSNFGDFGVAVMFAPVLHEKR